MRLGRRIAEWLDEARPTKDIFRFLAGGVEVVVWRVCNGNTSGGGCGGAGFSLVGAGDAFGRGGLFCRLSCLWYLLLVLVMIMVAVLFGDGGG